MIMQDRFKFRVYDKVRTRYIYCDFVGYCSVDYNGTSKKRIAFRPSCVEQIISETANMVIYAEEDAIIEQCTGLKDKKGKLIYEGDIVELTRSRNYGWCKRGTRLKVEWNIFNCCGFGFGAIGNLTEKCALNCIIVGNIHENPELMEKSNVSNQY